MTEQEAREIVRASSRLARALRDSRLPLPEDAYDPLQDVEIALRKIGVVL